MSAWQAVIGLEVHAQLGTRTKLFAAAPIAAPASPNSAVEGLCLGLPGTLPRLNGAAVELAIRAGLALGGEIATVSEFARKSYFYPDLPKGYQISQHRAPLCQGGALAFVRGDGSAGTLALERIHMEEDAGKSLHDAVAGATIVDLNRAGTPLIEIVSRPCLTSAEDAAAAFAELRRVLRWIGVCDGSLEDGSMRCDANVSVRRSDETQLRTRCEIKNLNSIKSLRDAITAEVERQRAIYEGGGQVMQQTRLWDVDVGRTKAMRGKEDAADYRYHADPDLPPLVVSSATIAAAREALPVPLAVMRGDLADHHGIPPDLVLLLLDHPALLRAASPVFGDLGKDASAFAAFVCGQVAAALYRTGRPLADAGAAMAELRAVFERWRRGELSNRMVTEILQAASSVPAAAPAADVATAWRRAADEAGTTVADPTALLALARELLAAHPSEAAALRTGKDKLLGFFMGQAMRRLGGKADAGALQAAIRAALIESTGEP